MAVVLQKSLSHAAGNGMAHIGGKSSAQFSKSPADLASVSGIERKTTVPIVRTRFGSFLTSDWHGFKRASLDYIKSLFSKHGDEYKPQLASKRVS